MKVGVLALQGAYAAHVAVLASLDVEAIEVRTPEHLRGVDALVLPGGESTTMNRLLVTSGLWEVLGDRLAGGLPVFGTCAGMILLADEVSDGRADQRSFSAIDLGVRRNGYGRQVDSFEADLTIEGLAGERFHAVFIRAPVVERVGAAVDVLAEIDGAPVVCRQGRVLVSSFHPELTPDARLHALFLESAAAA